MKDAEKQPLTFKKTFQEIQSLVSHGGEAERILIYALQQELQKEVTRMSLYADFQGDFPEGAKMRALAWARRKAAGESLQYILGVQDFFGRQYRVGPGVLIPRPETEFLVSKAKERIAEMGPRPLLGLELGIGSGAISIELLNSFSSLEMAASEKSEQALSYARQNAQEHLGEGRSSRLSFLSVSQASDAMEPFEKYLAKKRNFEKADFFISNPPYLAQSDEVSDEVLRNEPREALFAPSIGEEESPSFFYRKIAEHGAKIVKKKGWIFLEIPPERSQSISDLFRAGFERIEVFKDFNRHDRVLIVLV